MIQPQPIQRIRHVMIATLLGCVVSRAAAVDLPMSPRWQLFEQQWRSDVAYTNPHAVLLRVELRSPQGDVQSAPGFWDGGKIWRARWLPGVAGRWRYRTICSDTNNAGLNDRTGEFLCTVGERGNPFAEHGPLRVSRDGTSLEHADRTPFFPTIELGWNAIRRTSAGTVEKRAREISRQRANAWAWTVWPGKDESGATAFDSKSPGGLNLDFFRKLDPKVEAIARAGLLSVIAPAWEAGGTPGEGADEVQMVALLRHAFGRWHAHPSLWIIAAESASSGANIGRWKRITADVFADGTPGLVCFAPGQTFWLWDEFRDESWIGGLGFQTERMQSEDSLQWFLNGPLSVEHKRPNRRLMFDILPASGQLSRRLLWWGLLMNPPSGVSLRLDSNDAAAALIAAEFFGSLDFRKLRPSPALLAAQPGAESLRDFVTVAASDDRDILVAYVPGTAVQLNSAAVPPRHFAIWMNPRTGARQPAVGLVATGGVTYRTPGADDWVLLVKAAK
jgi:hypothetical protein